MPLITSHAIFAEKYAAYRVSPPAERHRPVMPVVMAPPSLMDLVALACSKILATDPGLVADVAAGRVERPVLEAMIQKTADQESLRAGFFAADLQQQAMDFLFGYGPLQEWVEDDAVTDIDGTGPQEFTIKKNGRREPIEVSFGQSRTYDTFCRLLIIRQGGVINENDSHCRVTDERFHLRINVTVPPRSVTGPTVCIRKHRRQAWLLPELASLGMFPPDVAGLLTTLSQGDQSILICGKGASGKTTLLRAIIQAMPRLERVLIAESDSEIYPEKPYCLIQRIKRRHEGGRPVTLRDLVADGLTMSLDTYCIGEIVGEEAMEFIRAAFSGHRCLATTHAESAGDALDRLLSLARPAGSGDSERSLKKMLASGIDYIIYLKNFRIVELLQVGRYLEGEDRYEMARIWPPESPAPGNAAIDKPAVPLVPGPGESALRL